ncbi:transposase [Lentzea sp. NPDC059081]|uniref:transposase n=1 Tax=Lentzea sp. NPDC059081 TaxID=3346719 RepID=UPI0036D0DFA6
MYSSNCTRWCSPNCAPPGYLTCPPPWSTPPTCEHSEGATPGRARSTAANLVSMHDLITDASGIPLAVTLTGGHRNDVTQLIPLIDAIPPTCGVVDKPRRRPRRIYADRGYDHDKYRRLVRARGHHTRHRPLRRRTWLRPGHSSMAGRTHFAWLKGFRRLRIRTERRADVHQAMLGLA